MNDNSQHGNVSEFAQSVDLTFVFDEPEKLVFSYQIDIHSKNAKDDRITLKTSDGSYSEVLLVKNLKDDKGWVDLEFPKPPDGSTLTMIYDKGKEDEIFTVFEDESYDDMLVDAQAAEDEFAENE